MKLSGKFAVMLFASTSPMAALAQGTPPSTAEASDPVQVTDIVVTAQRRAQRLQDVPISVTTASADMLKNAGVTNAIDLARVVPSLTIQYATGTYTPFIRGVGNPIAVAGNESSSSTYVDGIYIARVFADFLPLYDVERIEVLKGPQGTLFGRNSTGGLINLITRNPGRDPTFEGSIGYGNYDTKQINAYGSVPLGADAAISVSGFGLHQGDAWGRNVTTGQGVGREEKYGFRSKLVAKLTETTDVTVAAGYVHSWNNFAVAGNAAKGTTQGNPPGFPPAIYQPLSFFDLRGNNNPDTVAKSFDVSARIDQDLGSVSLVSISGYRRSDITVFNDYDYTALDFFNANLVDRERQFSQEIQLLSRTNGRFDWIIGAYYLFLDSGYDPATFNGSQFGGVDAQLYGRQKTNSYSVYAQGTLEILPKLKLTLGGRYTSDDVAVSGRTDIAAPGGSPILVPGVTSRASTNFSKFTYRAALDYKVSDNVLLYGSVSRGFKSGVYVLLPVGLTPARPEVVDAYELGFKSELLDRRVRFNAAIFQNDISDPQVQRIVNASNQVMNAKSARVRGAEMDLDIAVSDRLRARASASYLNAKYTNFKDAPFTSSVAELINGIVPGCTTPATGNTDPANGGNVGYCSGDATGNRMSHAPKLTANLGFDYSVPVGDFKLRISPNLSYNDGFFWDPDNRIRQHSYLLLDTTIAVTTLNDRWAIRIWGKNLTNRKYYGYVAEQGEASGNPSVPAAPRTYGIALDFKL